MVGCSPIKNVGSLRAPQVISQSVDDRTAAERGDGHAGDARMAGEGVRRYLGIPGWVEHTLW